MDEFFSAIRWLPEGLRGPLSRLAPEKAAQIHELRLRLGQPLFLTVGGKGISAAEYDNGLTALGNVCFTASTLRAILNELTGFSYHIHECSIAHGYLTLPEGHRVGIAGRFAQSGGERQLASLTSLNLRVARTGCCTVPAVLVNAVLERQGGILLVGEPDSGKTTMLRALANHCAHNGMLCAVLDERGELMGAGNGFRSAPLDVLSGLPKAEAIQIALRSLAPQMIFLDELGTTEEVLGLLQGLNAGVNFVATIHAGSFAQLQMRPQYQLLLQYKLLYASYLLSGRVSPGTICEVKRY